MSIKALALELYKAQQNVDRLEVQIEEASINDKEAIRSELREAQSELKILRNILNGEKTPSPYRTHTSSFKPKP
ncbi:MAG: hypothetical protein H8E41_06200 [Desulfobulbaceae bacterium]|uniref:Uncharacterized protein n=1 Tax=Candidatus Desulfobia pelagia TaxID=2841692 RepID=A0A8J6TBY7_9BACT|nr:hypothetical protein [Candidatus Desulfobia pelagia]